jgi:hypothetical protein
MLGIEILSLLLAEMEFGAIGASNTHRPSDPVRDYVLEHFGR